MKWEGEKPRSWSSWASCLPGCNMDQSAEPHLEDGAEGPHLEEPGARLLLSIPKVIPGGMEYEHPY